MKYENIVKAEFISRPNRFIARVLLDGREETVHVKNTGRCRELLVPGAAVYLERGSNPARKTAFDLVTVEKIMPDGSTNPVNMDSQAPNRIAAEWISGNRELFPGIIELRPEFKVGKSRFDFFIRYRDVSGTERKMLLEVKGCTLERDGVAMFPDAPTERGVKHVKELTELALSGSYLCGVLIVIQMKGCRRFIPNRETDPAFADALKAASEAGVRIMAVDCRVVPGTVTADASVPVILV